MPMPISTTKASPTQRMMSCGTGSAESTMLPSSVKTLNEMARPRTTRNGRIPADGDSDAAGFAPAAEATRWVLPAAPTGWPAAAAPTGLAPCAPPERKITGSTGRMHGLIPVISPPTSPRKIRVITLAPLVGVHLRG